MNEFNSHKIETLRNAMVTIKEMKALTVLWLASSIPKYSCHWLDKQKSEMQTDPSAAEIYGHRAD